MARPKPADPKFQVNIYPPRSLWVEATALAEKQGLKPAVYALEALRERVERDKAANG